MSGEITLRSLNSVLEFLAQGSPEYAVSKDDRSGLVRMNPPHTLQIEEFNRPVHHPAVSVPFDGRYYSIRRPSSPSDDNLRHAKASAFSTIFQMMVQPLNAPVPGITIAK